MNNQLRKTERNNNTFFGQNWTNPAIVLLSKTTTESGLPLLFLCAPPTGSIYSLYRSRLAKKFLYIPATAIFLFLVCSLHSTRFHDGNYLLVV